jgi:hypothetical protein
MSNSPWIKFKDQKPPDGENVLIYLAEPRHKSRFAVYKSVKISNGYMVIIDGLFEWDFSTEILCWRYMNDLEEEIPLEFTGD